MRGVKFSRSAKSKTLTKYPCIPVWQQPQILDPFDYKLRSKEEVMEQHKYFPPNFIIESEYKKYTSGDQRQDAEANPYDKRARVAKIFFDMRSLKFFPL